MGQYNFSLAKIGYNYDVSLFHRHTTVDVTRYDCAVVPSGLSYDDVFLGGPVDEVVVEFPNYTSKVEVTCVGVGPHTRVHYPPSV